MEIKVSDLQFTPQELKLMSKELKIVNEYNALKIEIIGLENNINSPLIFAMDEFTKKMIKQKLSVMKVRSASLKFRILNFKILC